MRMKSTDEAINFLLRKNAKQIFEAIEKLYPLNNYCFCNFHINKITEIKKKYTEED